MTFTTFENVIGGEQPLSLKQAKEWFSNNTSFDFDQLCKRLSVLPVNARWLRFGRSALGACLELIDKPTGYIAAVPEYQCDVVFNKILSKKGKLAFYPLLKNFVPEKNQFMRIVKEADVILTCSFFGSNENDDFLSNIFADLNKLPKRPWIIEDRVMASPYSIINRLECCDFIITSLRKCYPVPDGALIIACSQRAQEVIKQYKVRQEPPLSFAILQKIRAKVKRYEWLHSKPIIDDPILNGTPEAAESEQNINLLADDNAEDSILGSAASIQWINNHTSYKDYELLKEKYKFAYQLLSSLNNITLPVHEAAGIGLPIFVSNRIKVLKKAADKGLFLPCHWPKHAQLNNKINITSEIFYSREVTFPIQPYGNFLDFENTLNTFKEILFEE